MCHTAWQAGDAGAMLQRKQQLEEATSSMADKTIEVQEAVARSRALCIDALAWLQDEHDELNQEDFFDYGKAEEKSLIDDAWAATLSETKIVAEEASRKTKASKRIALEGMGESSLGKRSLHRPPSGKED